jgi:hypothetical protein
MADPDKKPLIADYDPSSLHALKVLVEMIALYAPDPALRAYLDRRARLEGMAAIVRYNASDAFTLFAPSLCADGEWHEHHSTSVRGATHSVDQILAALGPAYQKIEGQRR